MGDDDQNHAVKLKNDISELNDNLKKYITSLKQNIVVNIDKVKKLLLHYQCPTEIKDQIKQRLLIQAVLQRHVIELIFSYTTHYFQNIGENYYHLESHIILIEQHLSVLLNNASTYRTGSDEITRIAPTKLRQKVYSILSNHGFADVCGEGILKSIHSLLITRNNCITL